MKRLLPWTYASESYHCSHTLLTHIPQVPDVQRTSHTVCNKGLQLFMSLFSAECLHHSLSCRFEETNTAEQLIQPAQLKPLNLEQNNERQIFKGSKNNQLCTDPVANANPLTNSSSPPAVARHSAKATLEEVSLHWTASLIWWSVMVQATLQWVCCTAPWKIRICFSCGKTSIQTVRVSKDWVQNAL